MNRAEIAAALREIGELLRFHGKEPFRARAYETGARAIESAGHDFDWLLAHERLTELAGIGRGLAGVIEELSRSGRSEMLEGLRAGVPRGFAELMALPNLGAKKILDLYQRLGIETVSDLEKACSSGAVRAVKGFGGKTPERLLEAISGRTALRERRTLLSEALAAADDLLPSLGELPGVATVEVAGELRRRKETVERLEFVLASEEPSLATSAVLGVPSLFSIQADGECRVSARLASGLEVLVHTVRPDDFGRELHRRTGSAAHVAAVEALVRPRAAGPEPARDERQVFADAGLPYIPPELREGEGEIEAALAGELRELLEVSDVRGLVHCHTVHSDGKNSIEEMARAAERLGAEYLTITDHSPNASYAGGLTIERLERQWDELARVQERVRVKLLRGTESDILADGALDYPDRILEKLDIVIASIHARHKMTSAEMTRRLVRAMRQPVFKVWGHALGRLLERRPPIECRVEEVLDAVAESRAAIEVNGDPRRLDLEPRWLRAARERDIRFVVSTDAHSTKGLENLRFAVWMARRAGVKKSEVLNTLPAEEFARAVRPAG